MTIKQMDRAQDRTQQVAVVAQRCLQCLRWLLCCLAVMVFGSAHALTSTSTSITSSPQQGYVNQSITLTATVSPSAATGTVTFKNGSTTLGTATLSGGTATLTKSFSTTGSYTLTAVYAGDSTYSGSTSGQYSQTINSLVQTNLQLNVPSSTANVGQTFALTANVNPSDAAGTVTFKDGSTTIGTATLSSGSATLNYTFTTSGNHSLSASYPGGGIYASSSASATTVQVSTTPTSINLSSSVQQLYPGQSTVLTATISPSTVTGTLTFKDGSTTLGTATLSSGTASYTATFSTTGTHTLTAVYAGNTSYAGSTSNQVSEVVNSQQSSSTSLSASPTSAQQGQTVTLTAQVNPSNATGSVTFKDGTTVLGTATLSSGSASLSTSFSSTGSHSLTAVYSGGGAYAGSTSSAVTETVTASSGNVSTSTALSSSVNPSTTAQATVLTATVSPSTATGTVTFKDGSTTLGTGTLSSGVATLSTTFSTTGSHSLTASYAGATGFNASTSSALTQTVNASTTATTTTLTSSVNPSAVNQATVLTSTISPSTATGTVTFQDGSTTLGSASVSGGTASYSATFASTGSHSLTAVFTGSGSYTSSTSAALAQTVNLVSTITNLSAAANPATVGQATVLTATVSPSAATGTVTFMDGTTTLGTATLSGGTATYSATFSTAGTRSLTAVYAGSSTYATSTSAALSEAVTLPSTTTVLTSATNPVWQNQATTLTATVTPSTATGTVTFKDGSTTLGTATLNAGVATYSATFGSTGSHSLTAVYGGSTSYATSTSTALTQSVQGTSVIAISVNPTPAVLGQSATLTATVTPSSATGTVTFTDGSTTLGSATLSGGVATYAATFTTTGKHSLVAAYAGDANNSTASSSAFSLNVLAAPVALPAPQASPALVITYAYDANGNPTQTVVAPGVSGLALTAGTAYDGLNRAKQLTDPANGVTQLAYDGKDNVTAVTDPRGLVTSTPRDGLGQIQQLNSPDTGVASLAYDVAGNLSMRTDSRGVQSSYNYDALNRPTSVTYSQSGQGTQTYQWTYDQTGAGFSYGIGRLTTATFPEGSTQFAYDALGRVLTSTQTVNAALNQNPTPQVAAVAYTYDGAGHVTSVRYPSGRVLSITYANGLPTAVGLAAQSGATVTSLLTNIQHQPFGAPQSWNWAMSSGSVSHTRLFDTNGLMVRYQLGPYLRDVSYDAAGRITGYTHYLAALGASTGSPVAEIDQQFAYDAMGRITQANTANTQWTMTYDANGNRTSVALNGGTPAPYTVDSASNRLLALSNPSVSLSYDAAGNATADGNYTLTYDLRGRLSTLTPGATVTTYAYDNAGRRVRKSSSLGAGATITYAYDTQDHLLGEYDVNGTPIREYVWLGDLPVAVFTPDPANALNPPLVYFIHTDHLNTPRVVVDTSNVMRWSWFAEPFGTTKADSNPSGAGSFAFSLRFPGQVFDAESGMHYNLNRDYIPGVGRYAQSDPIGLAGGINTYSYVGGNPISLADTSGRCVEDLCIGEVAAIAVWCARTPACAAAVMAMTGQNSRGRIAEIPASKSIADLCPNCQASDSREAAQQKAMAFAGVSPQYSRVPWKPFFNLPWGGAFKLTQAYAEFFTKYFPEYFGITSPTGGSVYEHPFGHPDMPGVSNHDCPHFVAVNSSGLSKEFPYKPGS